MLQSIVTTNFMWKYDQVQRITFDGELNQNLLSSGFKHFTK